MIVSRPRGGAGRKYHFVRHSHGVPLSRGTVNDVRFHPSVSHHSLTKNTDRASNMPWFGPPRPSYSSGGHYSKATWGRPPSTYSSHSSYYKRRPRDGYINYLLHKLKQILREIYDYARRHPVKLFFMVVMPLLSSGALHAFLRQFGISLPHALNRALGGAELGAEYSGYGATSYGRGGSGYDRDYGRDGLDSMMGLMSLAKHFV